MISEKRKKEEDEMSILSTTIVAVIVFGLVALDVGKMIYDKVVHGKGIYCDGGCSTCGGGCSACGGNCSGCSGGCQDPDIK